MKMLKRLQEHIVRVQITPELYQVTYQVQMKTPGILNHLFLSEGNRRRIEEAINSSKGKKKNKIKPYG